jgi:hypothetical protein
LEEGIHINKGLLSLANVISALGDDSKRIDKFTSNVLLMRSSWIRSDDTIIFISFRISVGSRAVNGKLIKA